MKPLTCIHIVLSRQSNPMYKKPRFTCEDTEAQKGEVTRLGSFSKLQS